MNNWIESLNFSIFGATFLLSAIGLWFTFILPGMDRWSRRFFIHFFAVYILCCLSGLADVVLQYYPVPRTVFISLFEYAKGMLLSENVSILTSATATIMSIWKPVTSQPLILTTASTAGICSTWPISGLTASAGTGILPVPGSGCHA